MLRSPSLDLRFARRKALQVGGMGVLGLTMPRLAAARPLSHLPVRAKSVIFLFQWGGPSHIDTFDMKPNAPDTIRGEFSPISTSLPGLPVCEHLPNMAKVMHKVTLVHGLQHDMTHHNSAGYYALSGRRPPFNDQRLKDTLDLFPAYGSVIDDLAPNPQGLPTFVAHPYTISDGSITPAQHASFLGKRHNPLLIQSDPNEKGFGVPELSLPDDVSAERLSSRRDMLEALDQQLEGLESQAVTGVDQMYDRAYQMLLAPSVREAFDLSQETNVVRDRYGRNTYGQSCLLARRLVEAGVKFVNVYFSRTIGGRRAEGGWDTHGFDNTRMYPILKSWQLPLTDQALPALINDLDERGLLDETLIVWMGEFGRTPRINANASRDHWPACYTALLAGGGVRRGHVFGASNRDGALPESRPIRLGEVAATVYQQMGIDPTTEIHDITGRPFPIADGLPLDGIVA
ncbi:DUF1501 domain-containing protein [Planctomyces sp. SH-PL14]|uniref:DUF1501 domain-containing protein n=1 Tax=Planctomyces sp. SH-PL14 TaxID=1632864 RepID=UPI00078D3726|nr:DUF1501 domain-containing protein [Planctomyces sp. SH-PL14]AMV17829.1 hypothetical protein VT03_08045 [Planctomyces sp. SH-PL14]